MLVTHCNSDMKDHQHRFSFYVFYKERDTREVLYQINTKIDAHGEGL